MYRDDQDSNKTFEHKKSLGQNFLTSPVVPGFMCDAANIIEGDIVLEIGPGTGMLTQALLDRGAKVLAVEADIRTIPILEEKFVKEITSGQLKIFHQDARELDVLSIGLNPYEFKVVSNIPYYLSGFLLRLLLENKTQPKNLVFLIQKELAVRIARDPKESILSISVKAFGTPKYYKTVTKGHFKPQPKVDSAILAVSDINFLQFQGKKSSDFFNLLHIGLGKKRKQLISNLSEVWERENITNIFSDLEIKQTIRGEDLDVDMWFKLFHRLFHSQ
jgi:16S rRNA (adenine1518-N6/adenine1519-N6)-dimethyltransferase